MKYALFLFGLVLATAAHSADPWSGKAGLGLLATSGNTETTNVNLNLGLGYDVDKWHHKAQAAAAGAESSGTATAERYKFGYKAQFDISEFNYVFGLVNYEKDRFSGYDRQISEAIGYGRRLIHNDAHVLNLEAGAGFKQSDLSDGSSRDGAIWRLGSDYVWKISPSAQFSQDFSLEQGSGNRYFESVSALKSTLFEQLALVLSYTLKNNSNVPAGSKDSDTFTAISLEYGF